MNSARKPKGRTLAEFEPLQPAEKTLLDACWQGEVAHIADSRPEAEHENNTVRAAFLRFLALGGDGQAPVHERGVRLQGAWITGTLDLISASVPSCLSMVHCQFSETPLFTDTNIAGTLDFTDSQLPGFVGNRMTVNGTVFLNQAKATKNVLLLGIQIDGNLECTQATFDGKAFDGNEFFDKEGNALFADDAVIKGTVFLKYTRATGTVHLVGAQIGGDLDCTGAIFNGKGDDALSADSAIIKGTVLLKQAEASRNMRLLSAQIGGNLDCTEAKFDGNRGNALSADGAVIRSSIHLDKFTAKGNVCLTGIQIGCTFECEGAKLKGTKKQDGSYGRALSADGMKIKQSFFFRKLAHPVNGVSLCGAHVGNMIDDAKSWGENLILDGFTYDFITGGAPTDATTRLAWLDKQLPEHAGLSGHGFDFKPQPWKQLTKVLREMGHAEDARQVSIAFEERMRETGRIGQAPAHWGTLLTGIYHETCRAGHCLFGLLIGYGYRPLTLLAWMVIVWLAWAIFFWCAALEGVFGPSSPLVFQHPDYADCWPPGGNWYVCEKLREEYSGFSPLAYSLDVILPFVDLQQANNWAPLIPTPEAAWYREILALFDWKHATRLLMWFETLFGWVSSLLMVAVLSGLTKRREE